MAMVFADSFDFYASVADIITRWGLGTTGSDGLVSGSSTAFNAGQALSIGTYNNGYYQTSWGTNEGTLFFSLRFKTGGGNTSQYARLQFLDGANVQCEVRICADTSVSVYSGAGTTLLGTVAAGVFNSGTWNSLQGQIVFGSAGSVTLRMNGGTSNILALTGVNTRAGSSNSYANAIKLASGDTTNASLYIDDFFLNNTSGVAPTSWPGDVRSIQQLPTGQTQAQFSVTGAASNWQAVSNATEDGDTSYISSNTPGQEDIYTLSTVTAAYTVVGVAPLVLWRKVDAGPRTMQLSVQANGSADTAELTNSSLGTSYAYSGKWMPTDPTGAAWTPTTVSAAKLGVSVTA